MTAWCSSSSGNQGTQSQSCPRTPRTKPVQLGSAHFPIARINLRKFGLPFQHRCFMALRGFNSQRCYDSFVSWTYIVGHSFLRRIRFGEWDASLFFNPRPWRPAKHRFWWASLRSVLSRLFFGLSKSSWVHRNYACPNSISQCSTESWFVFLLRLWFRNSIRGHGILRLLMLHFVEARVWF